MYGTGTLLALDEQKVRLYRLLRVRLTLLEAAISVRCSVELYVTLAHSCAILLYEYTALLIMGLALVECMERVPH